MIKIGIPRALLYYQYFPAWKIFFEELGAEVMLSEPTTRITLAEGSARVVADTCLPVKAYLGHVLSLVGNCDFLFVPAVRSVREKAYNCSKFLGLPDMTKAVIPEAPPVLEIDIDINEGKSTFYRAVYDLGRHLSRNPLKIRRAGMAAWQMFLDYRELMSREKLTPPEAIEKMTGHTGGNSSVDKKSTILADSTIAVIGHPYLIYDEYINHRLIGRLRAYGINIVMPEMVEERNLVSAVNGLVGRPYWTYEEDVVGAGGHYLSGGVDGVIGIMAFGCGPDSLMMDAVRRQAGRQGDIPFMCLTLEEHTAESGIITRLEAFIDMMRRRRRAELCV